MPGFYLSPGTRKEIELQNQLALKSALAQIEAQKNANLALEQNRTEQELKYQQGLKNQQQVASMLQRQQLKEALAKRMWMADPNMDPGEALLQAEQQVANIQAAQPAADAATQNVTEQKSLGYLPGASAVGGQAATADQWDQIARKAAAQTNIATADAQRISMPARINMENLAATNAADLAARTSARRFNSAPEAAYQQDVASALGNQNQGLQLGAQTPFMPDIGKTTAQAQLTGNKANIAKNTLQQQTMEQVRPDLAAAAENNQARATSATSAQVASAPLLGIPGLASNPMMIGILKDAINNAQQQQPATRLAAPGMAQRRTLGQLPGYNLGGPQ